MREPIFLIALTILAGTVIMVARTIAGAISGRGGSRSEINQIKQRLEQQSAALRISDRTYILRGGRNELTRDSAELLASDELTTSYLR